MIPLIKELFTKESERSNLHLVAMLCFFVISVNLEAQVSNNSIHQSTFLILDADPVQSTTDKSTVEWACINKKLTEKCLIYHNDQWFSFTSPVGGKLFLNVSNQQCRKKYGVQVLVIEGNPCETNTYQLLHCESFTDQNDTFITIDSVEANKTYLINIDGFLGDICSFNIQLSTKPNGYPLKPKSLDTLQLQAKRDQNIVTLNWSVEEPLKENLDFFEVHRQLSTTFKSKLLKQLTLQFNAQGKSLDSYQYADTLEKHGTYVYDIIGVSNHGKRRQLLDREQVNFWPPNSNTPKPHLVAIAPLNFKKKSDVDLLVMNELTGEILFKRTCVACDNQDLEINLTNEVLNGIYRFRIEVYHIRSGSRSAYQYQLSPDGKQLKRLN